MYKLTQDWPQHIESGAFVNPESNQAYLRWLNGWTETIRAPGTWTPEVPATLDAEGNELTAAIPGYWTEGDVIEVIEHPPHTPEPYVPPQPTVADFTNSLTLHLDAVAQQRQYDNRITCMVRAGFPGPFQAEGLAFAAWADTCNATAYTLLAEVQAGTRPLPTNTQELIDSMPPMVWPI